MCWQEACKTDCSPQERCVSWSYSVACILKYRFLECHSPHRHHKSLREMQAGHCALEKLQTDSCWIQLTSLPPEAALWRQSLRNQNLVGIVSLLCFEYLNTASPVLKISLTFQNTVAGWVRIWLISSVIVLMCVCVQVWTEQFAFLLLCRPLSYWAIVFCFCFLLIGTRQFWNCQVSKVQLALQCPIWLWAYSPEGHVK